MDLKFFWTRFSRGWQFLSYKIELRKLTLHLELLTQKLL